MALAGASPRTISTKRIMNFQLASERARIFAATQKTRLWNLGFAGGASIISSLMSVAALALNTRGLPPEKFGTLVSIQAYVALCATICSIETWQCICRLAAEEKADMLQICRRTIVLDLLAAAGAFALAVTGILLVGSVTGLPETELGLVLIYSLSLIAGFTGTARGFFRFNDRFDVLAANTVLNAAMMLVASFALWYYQASLPHYVYTFTAVAIAAKLQLVLRLVLRLRRLRCLPDGETVSFGRIARMSLSVGLLSTVSNGRKHIALLAATWFLGTNAAGLVGAAFRCTTPLTYATELLKQVLFSDTIKAFNRQTISRSALRKLTFASLGIVVLALIGATVFAILAPFVVRLVLDSEYAAAAPVLSILLFAEVFYLATITFSPVFQARNRTNLLTVINVTSLAGFILVIGLAGPDAGAEQFALVFAGSYFLSYIVQYVLVLGPGGFAKRAVVQ